MENNLNYRGHLENIHLAEGDSFQFDVEKIAEDYEQAQANKSSIAIKILSIVGGFLASITFLGFLLILGLYESEEGLTILGFIFVGAALLLNATIKRLIVDTVSVSFFVLGLCLVAFGLAELGVGDGAICILFIVISVLAIVLTKNYILSFLSVLIINGTFIYLIVDNDFTSLVHVYNAILLVLLTYLFLNEAKLLASKTFPTRLYNPLRIGLIISVLSGLVFVGQKGIYYLGVEYIWASSLFTIPLTIYVISIVLKIMGVTKPKSLYMVYTLCILILLPTALSPAISGALLILLLCFLVSYKTGFAIGVLSCVYFIAQYYYDLSFTLLTKSIILFVSGIFFLLFYLYINKKLGQNEKV